MNKAYSKPVIEKVTFDYRILTGSSDCFESVMNVRESGESGTGYATECVSGTPIGMGWTKDQTIVP